MISNAFHFNHWMDSDPYAVFFYDENRNALFSHSNIPAESLSCVPIDQIFGVCDSGGDGTELVFSLRIQSFLVDVARGRGLYCVCIVDCARAANPSLNPVCALCLIDALPAGDAPGEWRFDALHLIPRLHEEVASMFECFTDPALAEQIAIITPDEQVLCRFGSSNFTPRESAISWSVACELASAVGSEAYVVTDQVDFIAGFDLLNGAKLVAFFSEDALDRGDLHALAGEFMECIGEIRAALREIFAEN